MKVMVYYSSADARELRVGLGTKQKERKVTRRGKDDITKLSENSMRNSGDLK